jgi:hypothetical protein
MEVRPCQHKAITLTTMVLSSCKRITSEFHPRRECESCQPSAITGQNEQKEHTPAAPANARRFIRQWRLGVGSRRAR